MSSHFQTNANRPRQLSQLSNSPRRVEMKGFKLLILFFYFLPSTLAIPTIVTRLINYQSPLSPFHQTNYTALDISRARVMQLEESRKLSREYVSKNFFDTGLLLKFAIPLFLVEFHIGQFVGSIPNFGFTQLAAMDTGSSIISVKCKGRDPNLFYRRYEPLESTSYSHTNCDLCPDKYRPRETSDGCEYTMKYGGGVWSRGVLATETFIFDSILHNEARISIPDITFGCEREWESSNSFYEQLNGVLALGTLNTSLPSQMHTSEFSYCIGNLRDPSSTENVLIIGPNRNDNFIEVENSTPFSASG